MSRVSSLRSILLAAALVYPVLAAAAEDAKVGVTAAVNPDATGVPPAGAVHTLYLGTEVVFKERVATGETGQAQLLFLDQSSLTVAPKSELTVDEFVYNPKQQTGKLAATVAKGLFRYVGGRISKQSEVTFTTPSATIGIRGGMAFINVESSGATQATFLYGEHMTVKAAGVTQTVTRPGFAVAVQQVGQPPLPPAPAPKEALAQAVRALLGRPDATGGAPTKPTRTKVAQSPIGKRAPPLPRAVPPPPAAGHVPPAGVRVVNLAQVDNAARLARAAQEQIKGKLRKEAITVFEGDYKATNGPDTGVGTASFGGGLARTYGQSLIFRGRFETLLNGALVDLPAPGAGHSVSFGTAGTRSPIGPVSGTGTMASDGDFLWYELTAPSGQKAFLFGGVPITGAAKQSRGFRVDSFNLRSDFMLSSNMPFIRQNGGGNLAGTVASPLYLAERPSGFLGGGGDQDARTTGLQASLAINGQGSAQKSAGSIATAVMGVDTATNNLLLAGGVTATAREASSGEVTTSVASVTSEADGKGNAFFGKNSLNEFALDNAGVSANNFTRTGTPNGAEAKLDGTGSTNYGFNQVATRGATAANVGVSRTDQTLNGFAAGLAQTSTGGALSGVYELHNLSGNAPTDVTIQTFSALNRLSAQFQLTSLGGSGFTNATFNFGGVGASGDFFSSANYEPSKSAFIDDNLFAAREQRIKNGSTEGAETSSFDGATLSRSHLGLVTNNVVATNNFLPAGVSFCQCSYLHWGYWLGEATSGNGANTAGVHLATWVVGNLPRLAEVPLTGTSTYTGHLIGDVYNNGNQYVAVGSFQNSHNFGTRTSSITVTNFDGFNYNGAASATAANPRDYHGTFSNTQSGVTRQMTVAGTFFKGSADPVAETGGRFSVANVGGASYKAAGIFAAKR